MNNNTDTNNNKKLFIYFLVCNSDQHQSFNELLHTLNNRIKIFFTIYNHSSCLFNDEHKPVRNHSKVSPMVNKWKVNGILYPTLRDKRRPIFNSQFNIFVISIIRPQHTNMIKLPSYDQQYTSQGSHVKLIVSVTVLIMRPQYIYANNSLLQGCQNIDQGSQIAITQRNNSSYRCVNRCIKLTNAIKWIQN